MVKSADCLIVPRAESNFSACTTSNVLNLSSGSVGLADMLAQPKILNPRNQENDPSVQSGSPQGDALLQDHNLGLEPILILKESVSPCKDVRASRLSSLKDSVRQ